MSDLDTLELVVEQMLQEDTYSRKNICWKVREELVLSFPSKIEQCKQLVIDYLLDSHSYLDKEGEVKYTEKKMFCTRILSLFKEKINPDDYIIEVLLACCDTDKQSFQAVVGRIKNLISLDSNMVNAVKQVLACEIYLKKEKKWVLTYESILNQTKERVVHDEELASVVNALVSSVKVKSFEDVIKDLTNIVKFNSELSKVKIAADIISALSKSDLFNIVTHRDGTLHVESMIEFSDKLQNFIQKTMYIPPFITKPKHVINNSDCGFYTIKQHCLLKKHNQHDLPIPLDVLNIQNSIELCIDIPGLEYDEEFEWKPKHDKLNEKQKIDLKENFEKQKLQSWDIYHDVIERGNLFYLAHSFDARLRLYPLGYHLNYMSCKYKRSLVNIKKEYTIPTTRSFQLMEI
jgi:hypothetical protein